MEIKKKNSSVYQVMLLENDHSQKVKVQEADRVNFDQVKAHLKSGGSVFITTKNTRKIKDPKTLSVANYNRTRRSMGRLNRHCVRV
jgi:hypothetical protein